MGGIVHVFDLDGHASANCAYAWFSPIEKSKKRRFFAVLQFGAIKTPLDAAWAAIVTENREIALKGGRKRLTSCVRSIVDPANWDSTQKWQHNHDL